MGERACKGNRKSQRSIRINERTRARFEWRANGTANAEIVDDHEWTFEQWLLSDRALSRREISSLRLLLCLAQRVKRLSGSTNELASSTL
jgi:hypothetical protein